MEEYYRTGKYADIKIIIASSSSRRHINAHRIVVCRQSAVIDAHNDRAATADDPNTLQFHETDVTVFVRMIEWMYGIDRDGLLTNARPLEDIIDEGQHNLVYKIRSAANLACIADKYQVNPLKDQALALVRQLVPNLNSHSVILHAIRLSTPDSVLGTVQNILASRALSIVRPQQGPVLTARQPRALEGQRQASPVLSEPKESQNLVGGVAPTAKMTLTPKERQANADRAATMHNHELQQQASESDEPPTKRRRRRTGQTPQKSTSGGTGSEKADSERSTIIDGKSMTHLANGSEPQTIQAKKKKRPLGDTIRISTALVPNDPPLGPHCHCHVPSDDPFLVQCDGCNNWYHPRCVGKGMFANGTYNSNRKGYMAKDVKEYSQDDKGFKCGDCEATYFGSK